VVVVLRLDDGDGDVGLVVEDEVRELPLAARDEPPADDDPALGEVHVLADLRHLVPSRPLDGRQDELRADVAFAELLLVHEGLPQCRTGLCHDTPERWR